MDEIAAAMGERLEVGQLAQPIGQPAAQRRRRRGGRDVKHLGDRGELVARPIAAFAARHLGGVDGPPAGGIDDVGLALPDQLVQRRRLADRVAQRAGVVIVDQSLNRLQRTRFVGADEPGRPALDPARDVGAVDRLVRIRSG